MNTYSDKNFENIIKEKEKIFDVEFVDCVFENCKFTECDLIACS